MRTAITYGSIYWNCKSFFSENIKTKKMEKIILLISFLLIFSDFRHNKFLKFLMENNIAKFHEFIVAKICEK
jgi:hypothetical protein